VALEARGDALFALGRKDQARDAYNKALTELDVAAPQRRLVEFKLSQVGGTPPKPESAS
jgi:predicted negative regulator of RcsB-dependent stress response